MEKVRLDADPVVFHLKQQTKPASGSDSLHTDRQADIATLRRVLYRIGQEIQQDLTDPQRIAVQFSACEILRLDRKALMVGRRQREDYGVQFVKKLLQIECLHVDHQLAAFDLGHIQHIVDKPQQMLTGRRDLCSVIPHLSRIVSRLRQQRRKAGNSVHRSADVVRHIGQKTALRLVSTLCNIQSQLQLLVIVPLAAPVRKHQKHLLIALHDNRIQGFVVPAVLPGLDIISLRVSLKRSPFSDLVKIHVEDAFLRVDGGGVELLKVVADIFRLEPQKPLDVGTDVVDGFMLFGTEDENILRIVHQDVEELLLKQQLLVFGSQRLFVAPDQICDGHDSHGQKDDRQGDDGHDLDLRDVGVDRFFRHGADHHPVLKPHRLVDEIIGNAVGAVLERSFFLMGQIFSEMMDLRIRKA